MEQGEVQKGIEAWNVAQGYTQLKILRPLVEMDKLVKIALYGCEHIEYSFEYPPEMKTMMRVEAIQRLVDVLREIVENSKFACEKKSESILLALEQRIFEVQDVLPAITHRTVDQRTGEHSEPINEEHFSNCLQELRRIKQEIPKPLNDNSLIFPASDEIDLDKVKEELIHGG